MMSSRIVHILLILSLVFTSCLGNTCGDQITSFIIKRCADIQSHARRSGKNTQRILKTKKQNFNAFTEIVAVPDPVDYENGVFPMELNVDDPVFINQGNVIHLMRRVRGIVQECCNNQCTIAQLESYCLVKRHQFLFFFRFKITQHAISFIYWWDWMWCHYDFIVGICSHFF